MIDYKGKLVLAPMVRVSELPLRKLSLKYGADLVWGPEIVDKRLIASRRIWNEKLHTFDYVNQKNHQNLTWRVSPSLEKDRVVFQLGSADPQLAVEAAKIVAPDVAAIDLNCGCPKPFSTHADMGSRLLYVPDKLVSILTHLVKEVGTPWGIPISAKIRILPEEQPTYDLVRRIATTGISHLTVHCRTPTMRPREPAQFEYLPEIIRICHEAGITCYLNGDVHSRKHFDELQKKYDIDGAMIARAAQDNPSCFGTDEPVPILQICREFLDACMEYDFVAPHAKYNLMNFVDGKSALYAKFARSKSLAALDESLQEQETASSESEDEPPVKSRKRVAEFTQPAPKRTSVETN